MQQKNTKDHFGHEKCIKWPRTYLIFSHVSEPKLRTTSNSSAWFTKPYCVVKLKETTIITLKHTRGHVREVESTVNFCRRVKWEVQHPKSIGNKFIFRLSKFHPEREGRVTDAYFVSS